ncbi:MAG: PspC domain-containing protein [Solirubrobacterales bacterium]|nr:PspC domain-containing protein [Solirubrobacterales bacterium]
MNEQTHSRKLTRSRTDRFIGGVAAGIATRLDVDPLFVRIGFLASLAFGGIGLLVYVLLLVFVPIEGERSEPLPPIDPGRRNLMIGLAVTVGVIAIVIAASGDFAAWVFGFWPGTVFGILIWVAAVVAVAWLLGSVESRQGDEPVAKSSADPAEPAGGSGSTEVVTYAEAPTQITPAELEATAEMKIRKLDTGPVPGPGSKPVRDDGPSTIGGIMVWIAIGFTALIVFSILFVISGGITVLFGGLPMAVVVILLGAGMVFAGMRGRRQTALWLAVAAIGVTLPMAVVSIADLRIEGNYGDIKEAPLSAADIPVDGYRMAAGNMTIDLRQFEFGRERNVTLPVNSGMGLTSIIVPDRVCIVGRVDGKAGIVNFRGQRANGLEISRSFPARTWLIPDRIPAAPRINLDGAFRLGAFEVVDRTTWLQAGRGESFDELSEREIRSAGRRADRACFSRPVPATGAKGKRSS